MTEAEWRACDDPRPMLRFLEGTVSNRKFRLIACGYCRLFWDWISGECRRAVQVAEQFADGIASRNDLLSAWEPVFDMDAMWSFDGEISQWLIQIVCAATTPMLLRSGDCMNLHVEAAHHIARLVSKLPEQRYGSIELPSLVAVIRCLGSVSLFRPVKLHPDLLQWNNQAVLHFAEVIYCGHAFDRLPILADLLEDAGCADADLLSHLRSPGPHVRGCWALDLILGKQ